MTTENSSGISRRTIVKGAAWAVPAVAVAGAAPAVAVSPPIIPTPAGNACKHPGNPKWYHFTFCFENTSATSITVNMVSMIVNGVTGAQVLPASVVVPANSTVCSYIDGGLFADSANGTATLNISYTYLSQTVTDDVTTSFNDIPPCGTGADPCPNPKDDPPHATTIVVPCVVTAAAAAAAAAATTEEVTTTTTTEEVTTTTTTQA